MSRFPIPTLAAALLVLGALPLAAQEAAPAPSGDQATTPLIAPGDSAAAEQSVPADSAEPMQTYPLERVGGSRCSHSKGLTS